jgi:uracil-DNA glycosylase
MIQCRPSGPPNAKIMIVGEAPGEEEVRLGFPFVGASGKELSNMLQEAGINRDQCFVTNVCRERPYKNDIGQFIAMRKKDITPAHKPMRDRMVLQPITEGYELLLKEISLVQPNLIIACGNAALWALTGKWGITDWRGSELFCDIKLPDGWQPTVIPILHPAAILRQWSWRAITVYDLKKVKRLSEKRERIPQVFYSLCAPDILQVSTTILQLVQKADQGPMWLSVDIETRSGHIACIGFAWSHQEAMCIPLMSIDQPDGYWTLEQEVCIHDMIRQLLTHPNVKIIGQNFSYDVQYIHKFLGILPTVAHDTLIAQHSMFSNLPKDLGFLSSLYCDHHVFWKNDGKTWDKGIGELQLWRYNCEDCCRTYEIAMGQIEALKQMKLESVNDFQQSLFGPVHRAMARGVKIDLKMRDELAKELTEAIKAREQWLQTVCGHPLNPRSPKQMYKFFIDDLHQKPVMKRRADGSYTPSFDDEALVKIAQREPLLKDLIDVIADIRSLNVFFATFIEAPLDWDQRMRCSYNIGGTKTYRFSSNSTAFNIGTNLQNLSMGDKD